MTPYPMDFNLPLRMLADFHAFFDRGALLRYVANEDEWRQWSELRRDGACLDLVHHSGAVARLRLDADERICAAELIEGEAARALVRQHSSPLPPKAARQARKALWSGREVHDALARLGEALGRNFSLLDRVAVDGGVESLWRVLPEGSALAISESPAGRIASHRWLAHGDALDAFDRLAARRLWDVPDYPGGRRAARTLAEAHLFLRIQRADLLAMREAGPGALDLLANTPEGRRVFAFSLQDPTRVEPTRLGDGRSACLSPVALYLFASKVQDETPTDMDRVPPARRPLYAQDLRLAAAAVEQALRFIPDGATLPQLEASANALARRIAEMRADVLSREALTARRAVLLELAAIWDATG